MLYKQITSHHVKKNGRRRSARRHFRDGQRAAALRAKTGAEAYLGRPIEAATLAEAAAKCGSSIGYVEAMVALLQSENGCLIDAVLAGDMPLLEAAAQVRRQRDLLKAVNLVRSANRADWARVGQAFDPDEILEFAIAAEAAE